MSEAAQACSGIFRQVWFEMVLACLGMLGYIWGNLGMLGCWRHALLGDNPSAESRWTLSLKIVTLLLSTATFHTIIFYHFLRTCKTWHDAKSPTPYKMNKNSETNEFQPESPRGSR